MNPNAGATVRIVPLASHHVDRLEAIARALPAWFGIEAGLQDLRASAERGPGFVAVFGNDIVGFVTLDKPFPETWEITWMSVAPDRHRQGIGRALVEAVMTNARAAGARLLHVKTLASTHPSPEYDQPRAFYRALGFHRLVVLPDLWGPENPCLVLVRAI